jgi:autotransporter-associated beta strand protein
VSDIVFGVGGNGFTITASPSNVGVTLSGVGIVNNSGLEQNFVADALRAGRGTIQFLNNATAADGIFVVKGNVRFFTNATAGNASFTVTNSNPRAGHLPGVVGFSDSASAADASFTVAGSHLSGRAGGQIFFENSASASMATFAMNGANGTGIAGAVMEFADSATAASATITVNGGSVAGANGGSATFHDSSTAANATLIANGGSNGGNGGSLSFLGATDGGAARVELFGNGHLDVSAQSLPGIAVGSLEGEGLVSLGGIALTVGKNGLSTTFSGLIQDSGGLVNGTGGSLIKTGNDVLVLTGPNTYTGGTIFKASANNRGRAVLEIDNTSGSGTGSGPVIVKGGALRGSGTIAGPVTVNGVHNGPSEDTFLAPGNVGTNAPATLTIQSSLTLGPRATYQVSMTDSGTTEVIANTVTINSGANIDFTHLPHGALPPGTVFTVITNTSAFPIVGTFLNLPDGGTFTRFGNTYQANYQGGDGNDLTLTVQ